MECNIVPDGVYGQCENKKKQRMKGIETAQNDRVKNLGESLENWEFVLIYKAHKLRC